MATSPSHEVQQAIQLAVEAAPMRCDRAVGESSYNIARSRLSESSAGGFGW
jgi:hypothetical protein